MKNDFWTTPNILIITAAMAALPVGAGAGLFLLKKSQANADADAEPTIIAYTEAAPKPAQIIEPVTEEEPAFETLSLVEATETEEITPVASTSEPTSLPTVEAVEEEKEHVVSEDAYNLIDRIDAADSESKLAENRRNMKDIIETAGVVEKLHTVSFRPGKLALDDIDKNYLLSALRNNSSFREYRNNRNARLVVIGYASKDGDTRNNQFSLNRAINTKETITDNTNILDFDGSTSHWFVGETDLLTDETNEVAALSNRAAEVWLVVDENDRLASYDSDRIEDIEVYTPAPKTTYKKSSYTKSSSYKKSSSSKTTTKKSSYKKPTYTKTYTKKRSSCSSGGCGR